MSGDGILAGRRFDHAPERANGRLIRRTADIDNARQPKLAQRRHTQGHAARDVAERIAAAIAVRCRIRQFADADAVEND
jgi:hypothetical protein